MSIENFGRKIEKTTEEDLRAAEGTANTFHIEPDFDDPVLQSQVDDINLASEEELQDIIDGRATNFSQEAIAYAKDRLKGMKKKAA